jgi:hypothetical protein
MRRHHFSQREFYFDPSELIDSLHDVIEAALDAGMDTVQSMGDRRWTKDDFRNEARAFAGRFSAHPSWRSAWERANRAWSDTD